MQVFWLVIDVAMQWVRISFPSPTAYPIIFSVLTCTTTAQQQKLIKY